MKKRSLFAAVVMLVVSAIVLTSSTYAWFASGSTASVGQILTTVQNSDGSLVVSANGTDWKTALTYQDFSGLFETGNELYPVDVTPGTDPTIRSCAYDGETFTAGAANANGAKYLDYTWQFKSNNFDKTIELTPTFAAGSLGSFVYGLIIVDGHYYVFSSASGDQYFPISEANTTATEAAPADGVIQSAEVVTGAISSTPVTASTLTNGKISVAATANTPVSVRCLVWAEGQDAGCAGACQQTGAGFNFGLAIAS
jgi:hypothetical protein